MAIEYKSILVAVDGSDEAQYAFHKAIDIANRNEGSKLTIANVFNPNSFESSNDDRAQKASEELVSRYKSEAEAAVIEYGSPKTIITREIATSVEADLILCGATGLNAVERFITGSVTGAIVRSAKCDVLVTRKPD